MLKVPGTIFLILMAGCLHSQGIRIKGIVLDDSTGSPVPGATIRIAGSKVATQTGSEGVFVLEAISFPLFLQVSHLSYQKLSQTVHGVSHHLEIRLRPSLLTLPDVEITGRLQVERVHHDRTMYMYDYEFIENYIILIANDPELRRPELVLLDDRDSISGSAFCSSAPGWFERDCRGNLYAISEREAMAISLSGNEIHFHAIPLKDYLERIRPCIACLDGIVFTETWHNNQYKEFYYRLPGKSESNSLHIVANRERLAQMAEEGFPMNGPAGPAEILRSPASDSPALMFELFFLQQTFFAPVFSPLFIKEKKAIIFDHANGEISSFEFPLHVTSRIKTDYHKQKSWQETIIKDDIADEFYTAFGKNGITTLKRIDLMTGGLTGEWVIPKSFISKIRIHGGVAYFMYKDKIYDDVNRLYRMRLDQ